MKESLLCRWFADAAGAIRQSSDSGSRRDFSAIVDLSRRLRKDRVFLEEGQDRYLAFVAERFLRSVHGNLFMDTPYDDELAAKRATLLTTIGECLAGAGVALSQQNVLAAHQSLQTAVNAYLDLIEEFNLRFRTRASVLEGGDP